MTDCPNKEERNPLIREGTAQEERFPTALAHDYAQIDERGIAEKIVSAKEYSTYLKYYDFNNTESGDWQPFFSKDLSALLAVMAVQNVDDLRININKYLDSSEEEIKKSGYLFSCIGMIAKEIDILKECLPVEHPMKSMLKNLIKNHLCIKFSQLICCYKKLFCDNRYLLKDAVLSFNVIISEENKSFFDILNHHNFSIDWIHENGIKETGKQWIDYIGDFCDWKQCPEDVDSESNVSQENIDIEKLKRILDQFLKVYARVVSEAKQTLEASWTSWNGHEPHYALFLAVVRLMEHARAEMNTLTKRHLDFYYRDILQFKEKEVVPHKAHVVIELAKHVPAHLIKTGTLFKAGKDVSGKDIFFANERELVVNQAKVAELKTVYRHGDEPVIKENGEQIKLHKERLYASSAANSADGKGGELILEDKSWHPFFNKIYKEGKLSNIEMPKAEIGFAIASHYLWMASGKRTVTIELKKNNTIVSLDEINSDNAACFFTGPEGWIKGEICKKEISGKLTIKISGAEPAIVPYSKKIHGYCFKTNLPVLRVMLLNDDNIEYKYENFNSIIFDKIILKVEVDRLKPIAVSNDFGQIDISKPFQPFGPSPAQGMALVIGLKEVLQKKDIKCINADLEFAEHQIGTDDIKIEYLKDGSWHPVGDTMIFENEKKSSSVKLSIFGYLESSLSPYIERIDLSTQNFIDGLSVDGFVRLKITRKDNDEAEYQKKIIECMSSDKKESDKISCLLSIEGIKPKKIIVNELTISYKNIAREINTEKKYIEGERFFKIIPFGYIEQDISNSETYLFPQLAIPHKSTDNVNTGAVEFYIGITDLKPPQNLSLLFQVADGTANPQKEKPPPPHIHWSYLRNNEWISFPKDSIEDNTNELVTSGIIIFPMPRDASADNTLLPSGMHWIRAAVSSVPDAVCKLRMVTAQALKVTFADQGNDPCFAAKVLPAETISKLDQPDAAVKKITQPFPSYGGRGKEEEKAFYTRVSERLRHKDRAVTLWDYERLILEQFPEVHKVKCLNHTKFEKGKCIPTPGHVTIVTVANQQHHFSPDPLRPNVSLGVLKKIKNFLMKKTPSFVELQVVNPIFEEVKVDFKVKLLDYQDETYSLNKLREGIVKFMSPWAFSGSGSPSFGGKIYKSMLINFVEEQQYVDYVADFNMTLLIGNPNEDQNEINGSTDISILVSAPENQHTITIDSSIKENE